MNQVTLQLQQQIVAILGPMRNLLLEAHGIEKTYFATGASAEVGALASDTTAATTSSRLTKSQVIRGITLAQALKAFFENQAVSTGDYRESSEVVTNGNATGANPSVALELLGNRIKAFGQDCIELEKRCKTALDLYFNNGINTAFASIGDQRVVFGAVMTVGEMKAAVNLLQQFGFLMGNAAVTTGDYKATIDLWARLIS